MTDTSYYSSFDGGKAIPTPPPKITGRKHQVGLGNELSDDGRNGVGSHEKKQRTSPSSPSLQKQSYDGSGNYYSSTPGRPVLAPLDNTPSKLFPSQSQQDNDNDEPCKIRLSFDNKDEEATTSSSTSTSVSAAAKPGEAIINAGDTRNGKHVPSSMQMLLSISRDGPGEQVYFGPMKGIEGTHYFPHDESRKKKSWLAKSRMAQVALGKKHENQFQGDDSLAKRHNRLQEELAALDPPIFLSSLGEFDQRLSFVCAEADDPRIATDALSAVRTGCFLHCAECDSLLKGLKQEGASGKFSFDVEERANENFTGRFDASLITDHVQHCHLYNKVCTCGESIKSLISKGWSVFSAMNHMKRCNGYNSPDLMLIEMKLFYEEFGAGAQPSSHTSGNRSTSWTVSREKRLAHSLSLARNGHIECNDEQKKELARIGQDLQSRKGRARTAPVGIEFRRGTVPIFADSTTKSDAAFGKEGLNLKGGHSKNFRKVKNKNVPFLGLTIHSAVGYETFPGWIETTDAARAKAEWQNSDDFKEAKK